MRTARPEVIRTRENVKKKQNIKNILIMIMTENSDLVSVLSIVSGFLGDTYKYVKANYIHPPESS